MRAVSLLAAAMLLAGCAGMTREAPDVPAAVYKAPAADVRPQAPKPKPAPAARPKPAEPAAAAAPAPEPRKRRWYQFWKTAPR